MTAAGVRTPAAAQVSDAEVETMCRDAIAASAWFGTANVVMQLARLPVGRGVAESTVDSGRVDKHPYKRQRTTGQYLIVALLGSDEDREVMRREVNRQHKAVVRREGEADVPYNAFDAELQLWVAACIYVGFSYWLEMSRGGLSETERDAFYRHCARLGTTLQVPEDMWPADREAFNEYWWRSVGEVRMDDVSRGYLSDLVNLRFYKPSVRRLGPWNRFLTMGFLSPAFRAELGEPWTAADQRRFDRFLRTVLFLDRKLPAAVRHSVLKAFEHDVRRRLAHGRRIV